MTRSLRLGVLLLLVVGGFVLPTHQEASAYPTSSVQLNGHGYGHGRGMGQWGAYGYATNNGWTHQQIVDHFYGGTDLGTQPNALITVRLLYQDGRALIVTSGRDFKVDGLALDELNAFLPDKTGEENLI